jgi:hypothetical protein
MTLQDFAKMTINVVVKDGLDGYLPTIVIPDTQEVRAIQGIPADVDHRDAIQNVIRRSAYETREFFFGVQSAADQIIVGHFRPGLPTEFMQISEAPDKGYSASPVASCSWWKVS